MLKLLTSVCEIEGQDKQKEVRFAVTHNNLQMLDTVDV
jgi:hypothetical protein